MRRIAVLDAPTNLGLRPPTPTSVPGCYKAPGALRDQHLVERLHARDAGCVTPPRYDPGDWRPGDGVAHAAEIADYSVRLADRIGGILAAGEFPLVLGGDCSVLLGAAVAVRRRPGRHGLVFVDGHSDFRHPGNASYVGAAAGEDLALVTGRGQPDLTGLESHRPYFRDEDVVVLGIRAQDEYRLELHAAGIAHRPVPELRSDGAARSAQWARTMLEDCDGYWVHVDVDVLDPAVMPAVDAPDPGGIAYAELELLLAGLVATPRCLGVELTVFDPDYDPDGGYAAELVDMIVTGLSPVLAGAPDPGPARPARVPAARSRSPFVDFAPQHHPTAPAPPVVPPPPVAAPPSVAPPVVPSQAGPVNADSAGSERAAPERARSPRARPDPLRPDSAPRRRARPDLLRPDGPRSNGGTATAGGREPERKPAGSTVELALAPEPADQQSSASPAKAGTAGTAPEASAKAGAAPTTAGAARAKPAPVVDHGPGKLRRRPPEPDPPRPDPEPDQAS